MKRREVQPSDHDEQDALQGLKREIERLNEGPVSIPPVYWTNLLVRSNRRIDEVTTAKALSISWAARVAIPGVVAILSFFIGLHYYGPSVSKKESTVTSLMSTLPPETVDSILAEPSRLGASVSVIEVSSDIFQFSTEQISDYLVETGKPETAVESLNDTEIAALLSSLNKMKDL